MEPVQKNNRWSRFLIISSMQIQAETVRFFTFFWEILLILKSIRSIGHECLQAISAKK